MKTANLPNPRDYLQRSQSLPARLHDGSPPSRLIEALDVVASPKRSRSFNVLAPRPTRIAAPTPPTPGTPFNGQTVRVREVDVSGEALRGVQILYEEKSKARWLMVSSRKDNIPLLAKAGPVGAGAHGRVQVARYEPLDGPAQLFALKEAAVALKDQPTPPNASVLPRDAASVDKEARMQHASGTKVSIFKVLELEQVNKSRRLVQMRRLSATPLCDGNLWHLRDWIHSLPHAQRELFVLDVVVHVLRDLARWSDLDDHTGPLVHCDVKPENIMFHKGKREAYLVDFSCAAFGDKKLAHPAGTDGYIAPEFLFHNLRTPKADMWSLGVTILDLLAISFFEPRGPTVERTSLDDFLDDLAADEAQRRRDAGLPSVCPQVQKPPLEGRALKYPLERYKKWHTLYKAWLNDPFDPSDLCTPFKDIDQTVADIENSYPILFPMMMRLLEWDPDKRPSAAQLLANRNNKFFTTAQKQTLASLWEIAPVETAIKQMTDLFQEPTLPALRRTTSLGDFIHTPHADLEDNNA